MEEKNNSETVDEKIQRLNLNSHDAKTFSVLVIDDDSWTTRIISKFLESCGFNVFYALNPYDGIALAVKHQPAIVFLDLLMPEIYGNTVLKILKKIEQTAEIPIVILSANFDEKFLAETYRDGAAGFISKPFTKSILVRKVEDSLGFPVFSFFGIDIHITKDDEIK